jgi:hypothetical protein
LPKLNGQDCAITLYTSFQIKYFNTPYSVCKTKMLLSLIVLRCCQRTARTYVRVQHRNGIIGTDPFFAHKQQTDLIGRERVTLICTGQLSLTSSLYKNKPTLTRTDQRHFTSVENVSNMSIQSRKTRKNLFRSILVQQC